MNGATVSYGSHKLYAWVPDTSLSDSYRDRLESMFGGRRDLIVALAVVGAVIAGVLIFRFRTPPPRIAPPATETVTTSETPAPTETPTPTLTDELFVHVAGAVHKPGLYKLPQGSRVADAVELAGGALAKADLDAINLAELLVDGAKIDVPQRGAEAPTQTPPTSLDGTPAATPAPAIIDINTADTTMLETIPGIGPVLATAIVQHRDDNGPFPSVDALLDVSGIGPATLESVRPYVTV